MDHMFPLRPSLRSACPRSWTSTTTPTRYSWRTTSGPGLVYMQWCDGDLFTLVTNQALKVISILFSSGRQASLGTRSRFGVEPKMLPRCAELFNHQSLRLHGNMSFWNRYCLTGEGEAWPNGQMGGALLGRRSPGEQQDWHQQEVHPTFPFTSPAYSQEAHCAKGLQCGP